MVDGIIFFESSGVVREAFRAKGLDFWSCDLLPADDNSPFHFQDDALVVLKKVKTRFRGFHPPCTYLCGSGIHWNGRGRGWDKTFHALGLAAYLLSQTDTPFYLENPRGIISSCLRKPDQEIQPWMFGADASKLTCLWLNSLPPLPINPSSFHPGRKVLYKGKVVTRHSNQTDSGQNKLSPSPSRWKHRSRTYPEIAQSMASTWAPLLLPLPSLQIP